LYGILSDDPKEVAAIRRKASRFYYNAITGYYIDRMIESSSAAYHIKRHMRHSKRLMMVCAELINLVQSLEMDSKDWDIICQR